MNTKKLKELNKILVDVEETPEIMEELTKNAKIKKCLADIFSDTKEVKYSSIINISQNDLVNDLVYNYAQENLEIVDDSKEIDTSDISSFALYLNDISYYPVLSKEEEKEIATKAKYGTKKEQKEARDALVSHNLRLVINVAKKYVGRGVSLEDLVQEGNNGLMMAAEKFDVDKGFAFSTYAMWWIRQTITRYIDNNSRNVRIPEHRLQVIDKVKKLETEYMDKFNKTPTLYEFADYMAKEEFDTYFELYKNSDYKNATKIEKLIKNSLMLPESERKYYEDKKSNNVNKNKKYNKEATRRIDKYQKKYNFNFKKDVEEYKRDYCLIDVISPIKREDESIVSLNAKALNSDEEKENELMNFVPDTNKESNPVLTTESESFWSLIQEIIDKDTILSPRDKEIARLRFGIQNDKNMTIDEISEIFIKKDKKTIEKDIKEAEKIVKKNKDEHNYLMEGKPECSVLTPYQRELLELKYSVIPSTGMKTKKLIGAIMNINPMRVREIEAKILRRLRNPSTARKLKDFKKK